MDTAVKGRLVFQNRFDGSVDFYRNSTDYDEGFGDVRGERWLGLRYIHELTVQTPSLLYLHFADADDVTAFQMLQGFYISAGPEYTLHIGIILLATDGTGPPNNASGFARFNGTKFSTPDVDRDKDKRNHCAVQKRSGWWHMRCTSMNVNGIYGSGKKLDRQGMTHTVWRDMLGLKATRLMFRRPY